jgi:GNAT superfamily N-acetyltransferase
MRKIIKQLLREGYEDIGIEYTKTKTPKLDSYPNNLEKVEFGNFIMINVPYDEKTIKLYDLLGSVKVFDKYDGTEVGNSSYTVVHGLLKASVDVRPDMRRNGIASAMYKFIEQLNKQTIYPDYPHTDKAEKFWRQPNRNFGPKEI